MTIIVVDTYIAGQGATGKEDLTVNDKFAPLLDALDKMPLVRFTAELLHPRQISCCLEHRDWGDYSIEIANLEQGQNGEGPCIVAFEKILDRFVLADFQNWIRTHEAQELGE